MKASNNCFVPRDLAASRTKLTNSQGLEFILLRPGMERVVKRMGLDEVVLLVEGGTHVLLEPPEGLKHARRGRGATAPHMLQELRHL